MRHNSITQTTTFVFRKKRPKLFRKFLEGIFCSTQLPEFKITHTN